MIQIEKEQEIAFLKGALFAADFINSLTAEKIQMLGLPSVLILMLKEAELELVKKQQDQEKPNYDDLRFLNLEKEINIVGKELDKLNPDSQEYAKKLAYLLSLLNRMKSIDDDLVMQSD